MDYRGRITIEPGKRGGKPSIRGLRITVYDVLDYLASSMSEQEILSDFPDLERRASARVSRSRRIVSGSTSQARNARMSVLEVRTCALGH